MPELKPPYYCLGLDLGVASCGFALIDMANHEIVEIGSHLFDQPVNPKNNVSLAAERRAKRSARRNIKRTRDRLKHCMQLFKRYGLVPADVNAPWLQPRRGERLPLELRAYGLDNVLTGREFAQVLYTLCGRRGYIPHGEEATDTDGKKVLTALSDMEKRLNDGGYRTVGEMLAQDGVCRNNTTGRRACGPYDCSVHSSQIKHEVRVLFEAQRALGSSLASPEFEADYCACQYWEKPADEHDARVYAQVGSCPYFPDKKRAASADVSSEICRAYEKFGHTVIIRADGTEDTLPKALIKKCVKELFSTDKKRKVTYARVRRELDMSADDRFKGLDEEDEKKREVFEPKAWRAYFTAKLPQSLLARMLANRDLGDAIGEALTYASTRTSLEKQLASLDLAPEEREAILRVPFSSKTFSGYGKRSAKALDMLVGQFEDEGVLTLYEAEKESGLAAMRLDDRKEERLDVLPPYSEYDPTCKNPVVLRAVSRARRVINAIIREHGVPHEVHIELARDLKVSKKKSVEIDAQNKKNRKKNEAIREEIAEILSCPPEKVSSAVQRKYELYREQGGKDIYTGAPLDLPSVLTVKNYCQIDHILPYSRTADDSRANKVLVLASSNQHKGNRTPYEWMASGEEGAPDWDEFSNLVLSIVKDHRKRERLLRKSLTQDDQNGFISRNLNDTRHMSRAVKDFVESTLRFPDVEGKKQHVFSVSGAMIGRLRRSVWALEKDRSDDRHHAVDAAIIAACPVALVKAVNDATARGDETFFSRRVEFLQGFQPWKGFREDVLEAVEKVVPTRMRDHGLSGQAYEDTLYKRVKDKPECLKPQIMNRRMEEPVAAGNIKEQEDGTVQKVGGMAFVRLWLDPSARPKGKVRGKWYAEPVYYADIPKLKEKTKNHERYLSRVVKQGLPRSSWPLVPESGWEGPIVLFRGDVVMVDNHIARFDGLNISTCRLEFKRLQNSKKDAIGFPTLGKWGRGMNIRILQEDCLGHCYRNLLINEEDSTFEVLSSSI